MPQYDAMLVWNIICETFRMAEAIGSEVFPFQKNTMKDLSSDFTLMS